MLEEALQDPSKNPAEVAQAMLNFVRSDLPSGGTSSEERFFRLFSLLCGRIFGQLQDAKGEYKHEPGGWLSAQNQWRPTGSAQQHLYGGSRPVAGSRPPSIDADPVVQLLGPVSKPPTRDMTTENHLRSLVEAITLEMENRPGLIYRFPFFAIPESLQEQWCLVFKTIDAAGVGGGAHHGQMNVGITSMDMDPNGKQVEMSQNSFRLFGALLKNGPHLQSELIAYYYQRKLQGKNQMQPLQLSPGLSPQSLGQSMGTSPTSGSQKSEPKESVPNFVLSMLEYYMFLFIRFPLGSPFIPRQSQQSNQVGSYHLQIPRRQEMPYGERIYHILFSRYLRYFLPHSNSPTYEATFPPTKLGSEFFLRVIIAFWLESHGSIPATTNAVQAIRERFQRTGIMHEPSIDLKMSYDLAFGKYMPPPSVAQKCLRSLVVYLITDPTIRLSVMDQDSGSRKWCLSQGMTTLQQPFYNYIRNSFRHASIHAHGSSFYTAMNAWLIWLEPWNVIHSTRTQNATKRIINSVAGTGIQSTPQLTIPSHDKKSTYTSSWEPYLAANLFLYTVPLAIFLRRARELDFSQREFESSIRILKRVFRVYTPEVVNVISTLTQSISTPPTLGTSLSNVVENHISLLGHHAPAGTLTLACCQADMQSLLEEIYNQHLKRVRELGTLDKIAAFLEGLCGQGVIAGEDVVIKLLVERAKLIVGFPLSYDIFPPDHKSGHPKTSEASASLRTPQGVLTDEGRQQLLAGRYKCSPTDVTFIGDKTRARAQSHEIKVLVMLTVMISDWLNRKLGLVPQPNAGAIGAPTKNAEPFENNLNKQEYIKRRRINLRWLADYRNLLFTLTSITLAAKLVPMFVLRA